MREIMDIGADRLPDGEGAEPHNSRSLF